MHECSVGLFLTYVVRILPTGFSMINAALSLLSIREGGFKLESKGSAESYRMKTTTVCVWIVFLKDVTISPAFSCDTFLKLSLRRRCICFRAPILWRADLGGKS